MTKKGTPVKLPYTPRDWQRKALLDAKRFTVLVMHRRAGKTVFDVIQSISTVLSCKKKRPHGAYFGPTRQQVKDTAWDYYKEFLKPLFNKGLVTYNESDLTIKIGHPNDTNAAKIFLYSYENIDNIRGNYLDHCVLDEFQLGNSEIFEKVVRPMLSDREGKCIVTGTPSGKNYFYDLYERGNNDEFKEWKSVLKIWSDTRVLPMNEIRDLKQELTEESFMQEYECSFDAAVRGAFFGKNLARVRTSKRIRDIAYDPSYPVITGWDIGFDGMVIWYAQKIGEELRIIDCDMFEDKDIPYCVNKVLNKPYTYQVQLLPHDAVKRMITDKRKTAKGQIQSLGLKCKVAPRISLEDGIHATRNLIDRVIFSSKCDKKVKLGRTRISPLDALSLYRSEYDEVKGVLNTTPVHDRSSHVADALRTLAVGIKNTNLGRITTKYNRPHQKDTAIIQNDWDPYKINR